jgi:hypothetical protein
MPVRFYMDVHIPAAITQQLRLRGIEVVSATKNEPIVFLMPNYSNSQRFKAGSSSPMTFALVSWQNITSANEKTLPASSSGPQRVHP